MKMYYHSTLMQGDVDSETIFISILKHEKNQIKKWVTFWEPALKL